MERIETEIANEDYDGLSTKELRRKHAKDQYEDAKAASEIRILGQAAAQRKAEQEKRQRFVEQSVTSERTEREVFIEEELREVGQSLSKNEVQAAVLDFVQVFNRVPPMEYAELLEKLKSAGNADARKLIGQKQVQSVVHRIRSILQRNRLAPAYAELKQLRDYFKNIDCHLINANEKTGVVAINLKNAKYYLNLEILVPLGYPAKASEITKSESNLPKGSLSLCLQEAKEKAQQLAEFPELDEALERNRMGAGSSHQSKSEILSQSQTLASRKKVDALAAEAEATTQKTLEKRKQQRLEFISQPSLLKTILTLYENCLLPLASQKCGICEKSLLPSDPHLVSRVPRNMETLRLYCTHIYHFKCVEDFLSCPPFGKKCLHCGVKIQHHRLTTNEKILEQRWTHQQARKREIEDISGFMNI